MKLYLILQCNLKLNIMELELKLKDLAPYLPYNLQGVDKVGNYYYLYSVDNRMSSFDLWMNGNFHKFNGSDGIKPILRPISYLTKEIEHNGEKFVPIDYFLGEDSDLVYNACLIHNDFYYLPYNLVQLLLEWHFDIFGLIEKGLAIDINTLNK